MKVKKIEPYSAEYERMANNLARNVVDIRPCMKCGSPRIKGYCCDHCGTNDPDNAEDD